MKVVVQKVTSASVTINNKINGKINDGYVLLVGFTDGDDESVLKKMVNKITNLRIICDSNDKLNLSIKDINGQILSISQFTLYAKLNGRRPSFTEALNYNDAKKLYEDFNNLLKNEGLDIQTGIFGEDMKVSLVNDGPITIIIDSKEL